MKKLLITVALLLAAFCSGGCAAGSEARGSSTESLRQEPERLEVAVFAAASMEAAMTQIAELYKQDVPNVDLVFTFDSSGTLKTQIQGRSSLRPFFCRAKQMNQLMRQTLPELIMKIWILCFRTLGWIYIREQSSLLVSEKKFRKDQKLPGLRECGTIVLGQWRCPVRSYSVEILKIWGLIFKGWKRTAPVTYASNVSRGCHPNWVRDGGLRNYLCHGCRHISTKGCGPGR